MSKAACTIRLNVPILPAAAASTAFSPATARTPWCIWPPKAMSIKALPMRATSSAPTWSARSHCSKPRGITGKRCPKPNAPASASTTFPPTKCTAIWAAAAPINSPKPHPTRLPAPIPPAKPAATTSSAPGSAPTACPPSLPTAPTITAAASSPKNSFRT